jgi:hypothetical protein
MVVVVLVSDKAGGSARERGNGRIGKKERGSADECIKGSIDILNKTMCSLQLNTSFFHTSASVFKYVHQCDKVQHFCVG